ncbi:O-antigen ligase family protein [Microbacteriaceae bacterium VKM Ac-2854]|nr:O-antigen ligase family protein [Microbacteriaceae bacterium VKM Ac-2854]
MATEAPARRVRAAKAEKLPKGLPLAVPGSDDPYAGEIVVRKTFNWRSAIATLLFSLVAVAGVYYLPQPYGGVILLGIALLYLTRKLLFSWTGATFAFLAIVMFIQVRHYSLPVPFSFALEPYRVIIILMAVCGVVALLIDPKFVWRKTVFGWGFAAFVGTSLLSVAFNVAGISESGMGGGMLGALLNILLMLAIFFIIRLTLRNAAMVEAILTFLVWSAVVVAFVAVIERATHQNLLLKLDTFLPLKVISDADPTAYRAGGSRAFASSQHPIALAVMFTMMIPVAMYLSKWARWPFNEINRRIIYSGVIGALLIGVVTAVSRTAIVTLGVMFLITLICRPKLGGILFAASLPILGLGFLFMPKVFGDTIGSFFNPDELIASQYTSAGMAGAGRLADLEPAMRIVSQHPLFGTGIGSRQVVGDAKNAFILDNQWLGTLMDSGAVGIIGLSIFFLVPIVLLLRYSFKRTSLPQYASLAFALAVVAIGYTVAAYFYDAFGFFQTYMLFYVFLAIGAWVISEAPQKDSTQPRTERRGYVHAYSERGRHHAAPAGLPEIEQHVVRRPAKLES